MWFTAVDVVAERNAIGRFIDSQERDFGHAERVVTSNNTDELHK
jgi:hypothetical protein